MKATYLHPYQMHGSLGSSCAVADVQGDKATIWSPTQGVHPHRSTAAMVLGLRPENVRVIFRMGSGCYGLNGAEAVSYDAALLSQAVGKPVRVQLTRKDEMAWENYGLAFVIDQRVGLDAQGNIVAWDCETWSPTLGGRPGMDSPGNVVTGFLVGFEPAAVRAALAGADPTPFNNGSNAVPSYVVGCVGGRVRRHRHRRERARAHPHREVAVLDRTAALAAAAAEHVRARVLHGRAGGQRVKADPVAYRLRHLARSAAPQGGDHGGPGRAAGRRGPRRGRACLERGRQPAGASRACCTKATTATAPWWPRST